MTRILHIIDHIYPVLGYQETHLAKAHSNGNQTLVITSDRYSKYIFDSNKPLLKKRIAGTGIFQEYGIDLLRLPIRLDIDFLNSPWLVGLENAVQNFKPDIIIAHGFVNLTSIRLALLKRRLPHTRFIFDDHMTFNATRGTWTKLLYIFFGIFLTPIFLKSANEIIAVTPETKEFMHQKYRIPEAKIRIVSLGIDLDNFYYDPNIRQVIRKQFSIGNDEMIFIYAGKIAREKGVHLLIDAAIRISNKYPRLKFMIVGGKDAKSSSYVDNLNEKIRRSGLQNRFFIIDAVPNQELYKYYNAADIGVWPLQCSVTMLEAAACGLPIIISNKSGATERVEYGNGLLYKEGDISDLSQKMIIMLDSQTRELMSKKAIAYTTKLSWKSIAAEFLNQSSHSTR